MCREEAAKLSSIALPRLRAAGVPLYAVVHENLGDEVAAFREHFKGDDVFLDAERKFFGPEERWLGLMKGMFRASVWRNIKRSKAAGLEGNTKGEGRLLGGVYVLGPGERGVVYEHRESEWGDHADPEAVVAAAEALAAAQHGA